MGKIRLRVKEVAESKGIRNPFALSEASGIYYNVCYRLWHIEQKRIDLTTLEKLCDTLKVTPARLLEYERDS